VRHFTWFDGLSPVDGLSPGNRAIRADSVSQAGVDASMMA